MTRPQVTDLRPSPCRNVAQVRVVIIAASEVRLGMTWAWIVLGLAWLGMLLLLFRWRLSRLLRTPRAELPHL